MQSIFQLKGDFFAPKFEYFTLTIYNSKIKKRYIRNILSIQRKSQRKMHRHSSRKFMRSPHMSPISCSALPSTISISKQFMSPPPQNNSQASYEEICEGQRKITFNTQYILQKLLLLERTVKQQKEQRSNEYNKIMRMVKEMSCKHTSIIYDTEIKYLKTCLSAQSLNDTFRSQFKSENVNQQKNIANYSNNRNLQKNNVTMSKKPIRNSLIDRVNSVNDKQKIIKNPSINILPPKKIESNPQNLQNNSVSSQKNEVIQQINIQKITGTIISKIEQKINEKISKNQQKQTQQLTLLITNKINQFKQSLKQSEPQPKSQLNSLISAQQQLQKNMESIRSSTNNVIQNLKKQVNNTQNKVKNNISLLASQFNEKIQQATSAFAADSIKVESLTRTLSELNDKLKSNSLTSESSLNMIQKKIIDIENFVTLNLEQTKKQMNRLQNIQRQRQMENQSEKKYLKSLQLEKQRMRQYMFRNLQQLIINQSQNLKIEFSEKMQSNYFKLEDQMLGIIERHVIYIENFIKKIQAREDIIIKKYFTEAQLQCPPELSKKSQEMTEIQTIIDQRSDELYRIMKEDFQFLNNKSIEIQSSLHGVLQRLNMQQGGVKIIN